MIRNRKDSFFGHCHCRSPRARSGPPRQQAASTSAMPSTPDLASLIPSHPEKYDLGCHHGNASSVGCRRKYLGQMGRQSLVLVVRRCPWPSAIRQRPVVPPHDAKFPNDQRLSTNDSGPTANDEQRPTTAFIITDSLCIQELSLALDENIYEIRREKLKKIEALGQPAYPRKYEFTHTVPEILASYNSKPAEALEASRVNVLVAGRIMAIRL